MEKVKNDWCIELQPGDSLSNEVVGRVVYAIYATMHPDKSGVWNYTANVIEATGQRTDVAWIGRQFAWEGKITPSREHEGVTTADRMIASFCAEFKVDDQEVQRAIEIKPDNVSGD